ncbi:uncharacterized protein LACBIDRAFT_314198 [Laccaria bicolor S238N-H82]|uniref:Predicted protein n=1 Tax=Laccaria bicolor (strain S238N-H82 / ATCC MYA-4686) TaxID=486041 RepID=B0D1T3_LACBS|nr:uncharacterized protein LACBIDRAFT_314198 [Laccaria bicolor S238N-H82]EDR11697.1 predicted protein [Laccaria bicolor S238N-H82]|eukprot:XP_001877594.1 predicted protein [Laccaria bicolor S238N-H82]
MKSKKGATRPPSTRVESTGASVLWGASSPSIHGGEISNSQRDQIRSTIIINVGGSDSDASRATSAVKKSNTSESAGGSPHASSSSTSDREQSSTLEESSVSTDSGMYPSQNLSSTGEVDGRQSPHTEEDDPVEEESSNSIYERHMYLKKRGFPLWIPQPNTTLSRSYQRRGVSIGDVGIFTSNGGFDFLFNVCLPAGDPSNPDELPEGFSRLELKPADVCKFHAHSSHSHLASPDVKKRDRAIFECSGSDGAILAMPKGAYDEDLKNIRRFREYTLIHAESWYQYANGPCGREIGNGELHLVTGCDKTTSWGIATYSHLQSKRPEDNVSLLRFNPVGNERQGRYATYEWDYVGVAQAKSGPEEDELMDLGVNDSVPLRNQCTFTRSLTPAFGDDDWERLQLKVASSVKDEASMRSPKSPFPLVLGAISSLPGRIGFLRGHRRGGNSKVTDSMTPAQTTAAHPAAYVIDMILRKCPKAKVVVVHDSNWCSVIRDLVSHELHDLTSSVKWMLG